MKIYKLNRWILTAGHCLQARKNIDVYLGYLSNGNYTGKTTVSAANQHIHNLTTSAGDYDIGLYLALLRSTR